MSLEYVYSDGTISVGNNSTSITGVGTQFVAAGIREGDDFRANGLVATIASVNSNTSITLKNGWPGASISSGDYSIRQYDNADRSLPAFNNLLLALGSGTLTSLAGLSSSANQMPYFSGSGVMALTGLTSQARTLLASTLLSRSGNNLVTVGENTRITGPAVTQSDADTTAGRLMKPGDFGWGQVGPVPVALDLNAHAITGNFRYGPSTTDAPDSDVGAFLHVNRLGHSNLRSAYQMAFHGSDGVADVSVRQLDSGVWGGWRRLSGHRGSGPNGEFVRFADGTQICWHRMESSIEGEVAWTFPATFTGTNRITYASPETSGARFGRFTTALSNSSAEFSVYDVTGARQANSTDLLAIGRWF